MMQDSVSIKERLLAAQACAKAEMALMLAETPPSKEFLYMHLRGYILSKCLLTEACSTDNLNEIMEISLARALHVGPDMIKDYERGGACESATPAVTKKILLFLALQKELQMQLSPQEMVQSVTITDLADVILGAWRR